MTDSGIQYSVNAWLAGGVGASVTAVLALLGVFWPAMTLLLGVLVVVGLLFGSSGHKRYVLAAVVYCLGLAVVLEIVGPSIVPNSYTRGVLPAVAGVGLVSAFLLGLRTAGTKLAQRIAGLVGLDEEYLGQLTEALSAFGSLLVMIWLVVTWSDKVVRFGGSSFGLLALLVTNGLGYEWHVTVFGITFEAVMVFFVGCVLILFHLLDTIHNSRRATATTAEKVDTVGSRVRNGIFGNE